MLLKGVCFTLIVQTCFVSCARNRSLAFVIDDTKSMQYAIHQVQQAASEIMDIVTSEKGSEVKDVVLVTFNDPGVVLRKKTSDKGQLLAALNKIHVHGGGDCPEYALTGIITALQESRQDSYLYVFTNADAKDSYRLNEVKSLCEKKQSQVIFVVTLGDCVYGYGQELSAYYEIARASNGIVFIISKNDVIDIVDTIPDIISDKRSVITSKVIPASNDFVAVKFAVDDKTEYVTIHTSGENVDINVKDSKSHLMAFEKTLWKPTVKGDSDVTIVIYAATDFTFDHGFSEFVPKSLADASKLPIADRPHHLSISVTDPEHAVNIKSAEILDMDERVLKTLPLNKTSGDFYITDKFKSPDQMFKIQVTGDVKRTGKEIKRISKTAIEPQIPPRPSSKAPVVTITEGSRVEVDYAGDIELTCKVSGYPKPRIWWTSADGTTVSEESNIVELPYDYISYLKLKRSGTYQCRAQNKKSSKFAEVVVNRRSPFRIQTPPPETISVKYGEPISIRCDAKSSMPMRMKWYYQKDEHSRRSEMLTSDKYSISSDEHDLRIMSTRLDLVGKYTCEAYLVDDETERKSFTTKVEINNLTPPQISKLTPSKVTVTEKDNLTLACKIVKGTPPPTINWQVKRHGANEFENLTAIGEKLIIDETSLKDNGLYQCNAKNMKGEDHKPIDVTVQKLPVLMIEGPSNVTVDYGSTIQFTCLISGYPLPETRWTDGKGNNITSKDFEINWHEKSSKLNLKTMKKSNNYSCFAKNILGEVDNDSFEVTVLSPFVVHEYPKATSKVHYSASTNTICNITSSFPMRIKWFQSAPNSSEHTEIHNDKKFEITEGVLKIKSVDLDMVGKYTCEASLVSDANEKISYTTDLQIDDLAPPQISKLTPSKVTVTEKDNLTLACKIVKGTPPPTINWQLKRHGADKFEDLTATGEELVIDVTSLKDNGLYQCNAKNMKGEDHKPIDVTVQKLPVLKIEGPSNVTVDYGSTIQFTCLISGYPLPETRWTDGKGNNITSKDFEINWHEKSSKLNLKTMKKSNNYSCFAKNILGEVDNDSFEVTVLSPFVVHEYPKATSKVHYSASTNTICNITSSFPMRIKWFQSAPNSSEQTEIHNDKKFEITEGVLKIKSVDLDMVGKYTCEASLVSDANEKISYTTDLQIDDLAPPLISGTTNLVVMESTDLTLSCQADGIPKPVVTWQFKSIASDVFIAMPDKGERISNPNIGYEKAGLYTCTATNDLGVENRTIDVVVNGVPRITNVDTVYYGVTGDKVLRIPCEVDGFPEPTITWSNDDKAVSSGAKLSVIKNAIYIKNPTEKDSNNYTCEAKNSYGNDKKTFKADISDFITYDEALNSNIYLKLGESADMKCLLPHSDPKSIRWYVNGEKTEVLGTFYSLKNAQYSNDGNYTCRLNTDEGSKSLNYVVDVGYKPRFKADATATIDWQGNKADTLDCDVYAKPSAKVEWFYNSKPLNVTWPELAIFGWGQYSCRASNVHDSVHRTFNVTSYGCLINRTAVNDNHIPLLIDDKLKTWPALAWTDKFYTIGQNETITLECATLNQPDNTFQTLPSARRINAKCYSEDNFTVDKKMYKFNDLQCKADVRASHVFTNKTCMKNGKVIEVGFKLIDTFLRVYEVCHSRVDNSTLYTKVVMSAVNTGNIVSPSFIKGGRHGAEPKKCAYNLRRVVNPKDVAFGPAQTAALSEVYNTVPVYEPCEGTARLSWSGVESTVKSALYSYDAVTVWTGASQYDSTGIPRYLWKVVLFDDDTFETIVYVNAANPSSSDILCPETVPDRLTDVTDAGDQFTYACSMNDFLNAFKVSLSNFTVTS